MKKILFRKLLFDCLVFFVITLFSSSIIIWVFQAVNFLDIIVEDGRNYLVYLNFSLLNFPKVISKLVPFVLFFSFLYVIGKYELKNENFIKKFMRSILLTPKFQKIINSFLNSYLPIT